jgi:hypothetical protein
MDEELSLSGAMQHDLNAARLAVPHKANDGVRDVVDAPSNARDRGFGLCAERFRHFGMVRVQDDLH